MSVIFHIMKEEYERLKEAENAYRKNISRELKGAPRIKHIGNKDYLYLEKREGAKVVYQYVGEVHSEKSISVMESVKRRKKNESSLKNVLRDLKDVKKVLHGKI